MENLSKLQREQWEKLWKERKTKEIVKTLFNIDITPKQEEIISDIVFGEYKRVVIACMTRYGKSFSVAIGVCLWILLNENKKITIVAPTNEKTTIVRNYIASITIRCPLLLSLLDIEKKGVTRIQKEVSKRRMTWKNGVEMRTLSAEGKGEQLMGFGADLLIVDEICDIEFEVYRSKITRMLGDSPDSRAIEIGNPWHRDNQFWEHWINPNWHQIHIGYETALKEGRITQEFLGEQRQQLTEREFMILYEAKFPEESEDQLIKYSWIQNAIRQYILTPEAFTRRLGVDVARTGMDSTVLTAGIKQEGIYVAQEIKEYNQQDTMQTTAHVIEFCNKETFDDIIPDTSGLGAGVTDRLNELKRCNQFKPKIIAYMGGQGPNTDKAKERFLNQKAEAYFHLRDLFEHGKIVIPKNPKLIDQLTKMKWELTTTNKIRIRDPGEKEGDTAEQKSPDFADSLCYFCWEGSKPPFISQFINLGKQKAL